MEDKTLKNNSSLGIIWLPQDLKGSFFVLFQHERGNSPCTHQKNLHLCRLGLEAVLFHNHFPSTFTNADQTVLIKEVCCSVSLAVDLHRAH